MNDAWIYNLAWWASTHNIGWLYRIIYRWRCPYPLIHDHSVRACIAAGVCACDNLKASRPKSASTTPTSR